MPFAGFFCGGLPWEKGRGSKYQFFEFPLPHAQEQVLEGLSTHVLLKMLTQKPQCFEKTVSKPRTQSILSRAGCVILASMREEGFLQQTELLVMELKYCLKMYLVQRQHPLEFCHWEVGVESLKLIQCYAVCIF